MEPAKASVKFILHVPVNRIEKINGTWYTNFLGSWESMAFGEDKPWEVGDLIEITFKKVNDDKPQGPPKQ